MIIFRHRPLVGSWLLPLLLGAVTVALTDRAPGNPSTNQLVQTGPHSYQIGSIRLDRAHRSVDFPAAVRITDEVVEYAVVTTDGKTHESILTTEVSPTELQVAVLLLGVKPTNDLGRTNTPIRLQRESTLRIQIQWKEGLHQRSIPLERMVLLKPSKHGDRRRPMPSRRWIYSGSFVHQGLFVAQEEGSIVSLIRDPVALINNPGTDRDDDDIHFPDPQRVPPRGTRVTVRLLFDVKGI